MFLKRLFVLLVFFCTSCLSAISYAQLNNDGNPFVNEKHSWWAQKISVIWLNDAGETDGGKEDALITVIKNTVNRGLGSLALIALIILMYGGFLMVIAAGDEEKYKKGFTILKQAAVGLILIGLAWFVISMVFWLINLTADQAWSASSDE